jgi:tetratricopeptide (TPR) repeat protein
VPVEAPATALEPSVEEVTAPAVAEATAVAPEPEVDLAVPESAEPQVSDNATGAEPSVPTVSVDAIARQETPAPVSGTPAPISITRSNAAPQVNAQLTQAYSAFRDQDYYAARALYQQALRELPNNRDALLGLAATSIQLGDVTGARATYSKLLELDPRDALARVGLMDSMPLGDPVQTETQLQGLKAEHPEVAQLSFALGNFYASQRRWNEAQAAYYDALLAAKAESGSAVSPDFAFNLAVSLERLNQKQPAFDFYREALEQSRLVNPGFDVRVLRERLDALERVLP